MTYPDFDVLRTYLESPWSSERALDGQQQHDFRDPEQERVLILTAHLQAQRDRDQVISVEFQDMLSGFNPELAGFDDEVATFEMTISTYRPQIDSIRLQYLGFVLPPYI